MILTEQEVIPYLQEVSDVEKIKFLIDHSHQFCFGYEIVITTEYGSVYFNNFKNAILEVMRSNPENY